MIEFRWLDEDGRGVALQWRTRLVENRASGDPVLGQSWSPWQTVPTVRDTPDASDGA